MSAPLSRKPLLVTLVFLCVVGSTSVLLFMRRHDDVPRYRFGRLKERPLTGEIASLEKEVAIKPRAFLLAELAGLYFHQGRVTGDPSWFDKAEAVGNRSLELIPSPNPARLTLAEIADAKHEFTRAIKLATIAMVDKPGAGPLTVLVTSHLALGNYGEAASFAEQLVEYIPSSSSLLTRGLVFAAQGREEEALFDFRRAAKLEDIGDPEGGARLRALWGRLLTRRGEYRMAKALFEESLRVSPGNHLAMGLEGEMELRRGNYAAAEKYLLDAFTSSKQLRYLIKYGKAKTLSGDTTAALDIYDRAEKLVRQDLQRGASGHRLELIEILTERGTPENVKEAILLAKEETKIRRNPETYYLLAKSYALLGEWLPAMEAMERAMSSGIRDPEYYLLAGQIEQARKFWPRAAFYFELALKVDPTFKKAIRAKKRFRENPANAPLVLAMATE